MDKVRTYKQLAFDELQQALELYHSEFKMRNLNFQWQFVGKMSTETMILFVTTFPFGGYRLTSTRQDTLRWQLMWMDAEGAGTIVAQDDRAYACLQKMHEHYITMADEQNKRLTPEGTALVIVKAELITAVELQPGDLWYLAEPGKLETVEQCEALYHTEFNYKNVASIMSIRTNRPNSFSADPDTPVFRLRLSYKKAV